MSARWPWAVVFAVALAARALFLAQMSGSPLLAYVIGDGAVYDAWAQEIASGDWIGQGVFYQAPLYPYFLGVIYTLFGHSFWTVRVIQIVLGAVGCALLGYSGSRLFDRRTGLIAGLGLALYPAAIFCDSLIQKEVLSIFLLASMLAAATHLLGESRQRPAWAVLVGVIGGLVALTRENMLAVLAATLVWCACSRSLGPWRRRTALAAAMLAGAIMVLAPVLVRNRVAGGEWVLTTSQFGPNLYIGNHAGATGSYVPLRPGRGHAQYERQDATELASQAAGGELSPRQVSRYWTGRTLAYIREQPFDWLGLIGRKALLLANRVEIVDTDDQYTWGEFSSLLRWGTRLWHMGVLLPLAAIGATLLWDRRREHVLVYLTLLAYGASVVAFYVVARYRHPITPMLMLLAATGVVELCRSWRTISRLRLCIAAVVATAAGIIAHVPIAPQPAMHATGLLALGNTYQHRMNDLTAAESAYQRSIALYDSPEARVELGKVLVSLERPDAAEEQYRAALALRPDDPRANLLLADLLFDRGDFAASIAHYQHVLASEPDSVRAQHGLGMAMVRVGRHDLAAQRFLAVLQLDPNHAAAHFNLAAVLARAGQLEQAKRHLTEYARLRPNDAAGRATLERLIGPTAP